MPYDAMKARQMLVDEIERYREALRQIAHYVAYDAMKARQMLVDEIERLRAALERIADYDVETHHGPVHDQPGVVAAEAFAAVSEIAAQALGRGKRQ